MALRIFQSAALPDPHEWVADFLEQLKVQYGMLQTPVPVHALGAAASGSDAELGLFFGTDRWDALRDPAYAAAVATFADAAATLVPVIDQPEHATTHLAPQIRRFNAFIRAHAGPAFAEALVDEVLTLLWQRRRRRRLFISYRRCESLAVARQLHDRYTERSFDVFLDERSIEPGVDFQRELRVQLDDSDAVLLLVTPRLMESAWVRDEVTLANRRRIGLLGVVWPTRDGHDPRSTPVAQQLFEDQRIDLARPAAAYDAQDPLDAAELANIDRTVFTGRAVAVAARIRDLVDQAPCALAPDFVVVERLADGDLRLVRGEDNSPWVGRIVPFRPPLLELWRWRDDVRKHSAGAAGLVVCYPTLKEDDPREDAYREICGAWGSRTKPHVLLRGVHL